MGERQGLHLEGVQERGNGSWGNIETNRQISFGREIDNTQKESDRMDTLALEAARPKLPGNSTMATGVSGAVPSKRKPTKKAKKAVVFFEVEILDAKTKDKLCFLDKVRASFIFIQEY